MTADLFTPKDLSEFLAVPEGTLRDWRYKGTGPQFVKVGRHVRYRSADVERWMDANTRETEG